MQPPGVASIALLVVVAAYQIDEALNSGHSMCCALCAEHTSPYLAISTHRCCDVIH